MRTVSPLMRNESKRCVEPRTYLGLCLFFFFSFFFTSEEFVPVDLLRLQSGFSMFTMWFLNISSCSHATQICTKRWEAAGEEIHVVRSDCRADDTMPAEVRKSLGCFRNSDPPNYALIPQSVFSGRGGKNAKDSCIFVHKGQKSCI